MNQGAVATAAGERLAGVEVQFNVDQGAAANSSWPRGVELPAGIFNEDATYSYVAYADAVGLAPGTRFWDGSILTDADGNATGTLEIDAGEASGTRSSPSSVYSAKQKPSYSK